MPRAARIDIARDALAPDDLMRADVQNSCRKEHSGDRCLPSTATFILPIKQRRHSLEPSSKGIIISGGGFSNVSPYSVFTLIVCLGMAVSFFVNSTRWIFVSFKHPSATAEILAYRSQSNAEGQRSFADRRFESCVNQPRLLQLYRHRFNRP